MEKSLELLCPNIRIFLLEVSVLAFTSIQNKTGTSKVGAIPKAEKAQKTFVKKLKFLIFFFQKMSHSAKKCKKGTLWALLTYILLQKIKKTRKGESFETLKSFRKKSHNAEKNRRFSLVRFCRLRLKSKK